jgi:fatty acid desaturase
MGWTFLNAKTRTIEMNENNFGRNNGIGFTGLLQLAFIILKLLKVINWTWVWVLAPIWITTGLTIMIIVVCFFPFGGHAGAVLRPARNESVEPGFFLIPAICG